jgi:hypothetical protein
MGAVAAPRYLETVLVLGVDVLAWVAGGAVLAALALLLLLLAPWRSVRGEAPLPSDVQTRLLLGEDPAQVAADADRRSAGPVPGPDPDAEAHDDAEALAALAALGDPEDPEDPEDPANPDAPDAPVTADGAADGAGDGDPPVT